TVRAGPTDGRAVSRDLYACAILPSLRAVVVHLHGLGEPNRQDAPVVASIAGSINVGGEPALAKAGAVVTLPEGIAFTTPGGFVAVGESDAGRTERRLWPAPVGGANPKKAENFERD